MSHEHHTEHPDIGCIEAIEGLYALLDGELSDPAVVAEVEAHIAHCRSCFSRAELERQLTERIRQLHSVRTDQSNDVPERLQKRLREIIRKD